MSREWQASNLFGRRTVPAVAALVILSFVLMAALLVKIAGDLDRHASEQAARFAHAAIERRLHETEREVKDYAAWGEAYQHLHLKTDVEWAFNRQNAGPTLYTDLGYDFVFVVGPDGRLTYAMVNGELAKADARDLLHGGLNQIVAAARGATPGESKPVSGFLMWGATPVMVAASAISAGGDPTIVQTAGAPSVLVFADALTPARLDEIGRKFFVRGLGVGDGDAWASETVASEDGSLQVRLTWDPEQPGRLLLVRVLPWLCMAGAAFALLSVLIVRQTIKSARAIALKAQQLAAAHQQLEYSALHDTVTELPNRRMLFAYLNRTLRSSPTGELALLFIDLDAFKPVNDTFGHIFGDQVLRTTAGRLRMVIQQADIVARVGGDEFVIVLNGAARSDVVEHVCRRLLEIVPMPLLLDGKAVSVGLSIGIAMAPADAASSDELLRMADIAMYRAKRAGGASYRFFDVSKAPTTTRAAMRIA